MGKISAIGRMAFGMAVLGWLVFGSAGCTRVYYRRQADNEVADILKEKDQFPDWKIEQMHVYPDPRARFADPTDPDHPPMPPDDEAAWKVSPHPQQPGHSGVGNIGGTAYLEMIKLWDEQARTTREAAVRAEQGEGSRRSPEKQPVQTYFEEPLNATQRGFLLTLDQAVELGVINSPQYQTFREQLYLQALPVTQQRFNFSYEWAAVADFIRQMSGGEVTGGAQNNWTGASSIGFSKLFSTGALLTADFANTTAINLGGVGGTTSVSTIGVGFLQPLLQGGGKAVTLEPLTQAERNLFYSIRAFARFREQFYVSVAQGNNLPGSLETAVGFSNTTNPISVLAALNIASTDVSGGFVGYLSTLFRECDMAADKKLVQDLERALRILEGYQEGGLFSPLQVDQVRSTLKQAQNGVLTDYQFVTNALDQFKLVLGLPANTPLILDDTPARPMTRQFDRYYEVIDDADTAGKLVEKQETLAPEKLRGFLLDMFAKDPLVRGTEFVKKMPGSWAAWSQGSDDAIKTRLSKIAAERRKLLDLKTDLEAKKQAWSDAQARQLANVEFEIDLGGLEQVLRRYEAKSWEKLGKKDAATQERIKMFRSATQAAEFVLVWARNERFDDVGRLWPTPPGAYVEELNMVTTDVDLAQQRAVQIALANRWDLMNARAQVVDAWRQVRVSANALMGVFNVGYNLESATPLNGSHPLAFSTAATAQQITFNFQLPLNRMAQRNAYRAALINYQQARRSLMVLEDNIAVQVRFDVRQLQLFNNNYRIQKDVIQSLYKQVESALEVITSPVDPDQLKQTGTTGAATAAALTQQYLTALNSLNGAQTKMYDIWLSFLATRMQLYLDLERLPLDFRGVWSDDAQAPAAPPAPQVAAQPLAARGLPRITTAPNVGDDAARVPLVFIDHPFAGAPVIEREPVPVTPVSLRPTFGEIK